MEKYKAKPQGYMTIGEVAKKMGVTVRTLQSYDKKRFFTLAAYLPALSYFICPCYFCNGIAQYWKYRIALEIIRNFFPNSKDIR